jgi:uncharacterized membrane protein
VNEEERRRFESLESLRRAAYESFDSRRSYEWKLSLGIWTAEALALVALLQPTNRGEDFPLKSHWALGGAGLVVLVLVFLHAYLSDGFAKANGCDKAEVRRFKKEMETIALQVAKKRDDEGACGDDEGARGWKQWSHLGQIGITALLACTGVLVIVLRSVA